MYVWAKLMTTYEQNLEEKVSRETDFTIILLFDYNNFILVYGVGVWLSLASFLTTRHTCFPPTNKICGSLTQACWTVTFRSHDFLVAFN
jgi:hypothetical protein